MISHFPLIKLPEPLAMICQMSLKNTKTCHEEISTLIEKDTFLDLFVQQAFQELRLNGGAMGLLNHLGWQKFRNYLAEAYLYYARHGRYPKKIVLDEVRYVLQIEQRFEFLFSETSSRVFLLGLYLKLCKIEMENSKRQYDVSFRDIPKEVETILKTGKSKSEVPDWLVVIVWSFYTKHGKSKCLEYFSTYKGNIFEIMNQITVEDHNDFITDLLSYGYATYDTDLFTAQKV